jgi:PTS system nitrogen regulatory IIA component
MSIAEQITKDVVKVSLESKGKPEVLRELAEILWNAGVIDDVDAVLAAIDRREEKGSTGLEFGIAVPHAKSERVKQLTMAVSISKEGIGFDALDGEPSKLFFLMLAPPDQTGSHIEALAEIAKLARVGSSAAE